MMNAFVPVSEMLLKYGIPLPVDRGDSINDVGGYASHQHSTSENGNTTANGITVANATTTTTVAAITTHNGHLADDSEVSNDTGSGRETLDHVLDLMFLAK